MNYFITGTDTGVGKTFVATMLIRALRAAGHDTVGMKPICCGDRADAEALLAASGGEISIDDVNPVWLRTPAAPFAAAGIENREVDLDAVRQTFARLRRTHRSLVVEGVGGWLVPIASKFFVADLAAEFSLPVVVVASNRLGTINHTLLTVREIKLRGLSCEGVIFNHDSEAAATTRRADLESHLEVPILMEITRGQKEVAVLPERPLES